MYMAVALTFLTRQPSSHNGLTLQSDAITYFRRGVDILMPQRPKAGPASRAKTFCFQKQLYVLPDMDAAEVTNVQPNDLMMKLKACNSRLPPQEENVAFVSAAFHLIRARFRGGFLTDVELRRAKYQVEFVTYSPLWVNMITVESELC